MTNGSEKNIGETNPALRPKSLLDFRGQERVCRQLEVAIAGAKSRHGLLSHGLFFGPPGLGKTTLAQIVSHEMGGAFKSITAPMLQKPGDLATLLVSLEEGSVFFIDEIHRLPVVVEEILYPAMEDFKLDILTGDMGSAQAISLDLPRFTLIGATTKSGSLSRPLRDRFKNLYHLELYDDDVMCQILQRSSSLQGYPLSDSCARLLAKRSRGTPRIANRLLGHVLDYMAWSKQSVITTDVVEKSCSTYGVDEHGLEERDRRYLSCLRDRFRGKPVGLNTLSSTLGEDKATLEDEIEPYLIQKGFINRTSKGRVLVSHGELHV